MLWMVDDVTGSVHMVGHSMPNHCSLFLSHPSKLTSGSYNIHQTNLWSHSGLVPGHTITFTRVYTANYQHSMEPFSKH